MYWCVALVPGEAEEAGAVGDRAAAEGAGGEDELEREDEAAAAEGVVAAAADDREAAALRVRVDRAAAAGLRREGRDPGAAAQPERVPEVELPAERDGRQRGVGLVAPLDGLLVLEVAAALDLEQPEELRRGGGADAQVEVAADALEVGEVARAAEDRRPEAE